MRRFFCLFAILIVALFASSCFSSAKSTDIKSLSAEETIKYFFDRYSEKDLSGMNKVVYEKKRLDNSRFDNIISVKLISCTEEKDPARIHFSSLWYDDEPYAYTLVRVKYNIQFEDDTDWPIKSGEHEFDYYLVKASKASGWIIVMSGLG